MWRESGESTESDYLTWDMRWTRKRNDWGDDNDKSGSRFQIRWCMWCRIDLWFVLRRC